MKKVVVFLALTLAGCAGKRYEVCISVHDGAACMHDGLSKPDAVHVGSALAALGYDVTVQPKTKESKLPPLPPAGTNGAGDADVQVAPETKQI